MILLELVVELHSADQHIKASVHWLIYDTYALCFPHFESRLHCYNNGILSNRMLKGHVNPALVLQGR